MSFEVGFLIGAILAWPIGLWLANRSSRKFWEKWRKEQGYK